MIKNTIWILVLLLALTGCEDSYDYSYQVTNKSDAEIKIHVKTFRIDSVFIIPKDSSKLLFIDEHGIEGFNGPYFDNVTGDLDIFKVTNNGTITSERDYLENEVWAFDKGAYSTVVTNVEFK